MNILIFIPICYLSYEMNEFWERGGRESLNESRP